MFHSVCVCQSVRVFYFYFPSRNAFTELAVCLRSMSDRINIPWSIKILLRCIFYDELKSSISIRHFWYGLQHQELTHDPKPLKRLHCGIKLFLDSLINLSENYIKFINNFKFRSIVLPGMADSHFSYVRIYQILSLSNKQWLYNCWFST